MGDYSEKGGGNGSFVPFLDPVEDTMQGYANDVGVGIGDFGATATVPTDYGLEGGGYSNAPAPTYEPAPAPAPTYDYSPVTYGDNFSDYGVTDYGGSGGSGGYVEPAPIVDTGYLPDYGGYNPSDYGTSDYGGALPPTSAPTEGYYSPTTYQPAPVAEPPVGYTGYGAQEFIQANAPASTTPAGSSGGADLTQLAAINTNSMANMGEPGATSGGAVNGTLPAGPSAVGGLPGTTAAPDLTRTNRTERDRDRSERSWMDTLRVNPAGLATAVGGLALNAINGQRTAQPVANLQNQAARNEQLSRDLVTRADPVIDRGLDTTDRGVGIVEQGVGRINESFDTMNRGVATLEQGTADLRARAASTDPNARTLMDRGTGLTGYVGTGTLPPEMQTQIDTAKADARAELLSKYAARGMPTDPRKNSSLRAELLDLDRRSTIMASQMAENLAKTGLGILEGGAGLNRTSGALEGQAGGFGSNIVAGGTAQAGAGTNIAGAGTNVGQLGIGTSGVGQSLINSGVAASGLTQQAYDSLVKADQAQSDRTQKAIAAMAAALSGRTPTTTTTV